MDPLAEKALSFLISNLPSRNALLIGAPLGILWSCLCLRFAGYLKLGKGFRTGYTRKAFHFLIFTSVVIIQFLWGTGAVCLFGGMCSLVIFFAILKGDGNILYETLAREKDEPHRTYYIVIPYFATLIGGLAANILFGDLAVVGYLVTGIGDAIGEPVGVRFGRHTYRVLSLASVKSTRSWEGSLAVFAMSVAAIAAAVAILPGLNFRSGFLITIPLIGLASAAVEAATPHGWDNATMQIVPSFLAWLLL